MGKKSHTVTEDKHLSRVASLPCMLGVALGQYDHGPSSIHHIRTGQGGSQRASHFLTIPLCHECHQGDLGVHGDKTLMHIAKVGELDLLAMTTEMLLKQYG